MQFRQMFWQGARALREMELSMYAAYAGYFIILSVFPALLLLLSVLRYTGLRIEDLLEILHSLLPEALMDTARELILNIYRNSSATLAGVSALTAVWSSSRGISGLLTGLNAVYGVAESRNYLKTRAISVLYTFAFHGVIFLTLAMHVFGGVIARFLGRLDSPVIRFLTGLLDWRFFLLLVVQTVLFTLMYTFLPNRRNRFFRSLPGGITASIGWMAFSNIYSAYVRHFPSYANIYGSVYAIAVSMLWLYFCLSILFFGGALNRWLAEQGWFEG